jgi:hypothetical protein
MKNRFDTADNAEQNLGALCPVPTHNLPVARLIPDIHRREIIEPEIIEPEIINPSPKRFSLRNDSGFWELTFAGYPAVLKQNPVLFYVAYLLSNPPNQPLSGPALASRVWAQFCNNRDFNRDLRWLTRHFAEAGAAKVLRKKQRQLEAIIDSPYETPEVKNETLKELVLVYDLQATLALASPEPELTFLKNMGTGFRILIEDLATAVDFYGRPHEILQAFGRHLLLYLIIPSIRTGGSFIYERPAGVTWEPLS